MATAEPGGSTTTSATNGIDSSKNLVEVMTKSETETALAGKQDTLSTSQQAAVDSGITKDKVTSYSMTTQNLIRLGNRVDTIEDSVEGKQDGITVSSSAPTSSDGADGDIWLTYGADSGTLPENVLTQAQLNACNSGITSSKVSTYDGYASGKQDKLTAGTNIQISGNTISATDTKYTLPTASASVLGGVKVGSGLSISNGVLSATGGGGGASLPENGYYWEKIDTSNYSTLANNDILMTYPSRYQYTTNTSWATTITYSSVTQVPKHLNCPCIFEYLISSEDFATSIQGVYHIGESAGAVYTNNYLSLATKITSLSKEILQLNFIAWNGKERSTHTIYNMTLQDCIDMGLYRLRKFSS